MSGNCCTISHNSEALWTAKAVRAVVQHEYQCRKGHGSDIFSSQQERDNRMLSREWPKVESKPEQSICVWLGTSEL